MRHVNANAAAQSQCVSVSGCFCETETESETESVLSARVPVSRPSASRSTLLSAECLHWRQMQLRPVSRVGTRRRSQRTALQSASRKKIQMGQQFFKCNRLEEEERKLAEGGGAAEEKKKKKQVDLLFIWLLVLH